MLYLLLILFPITIAASTFVLRKHTGIILLAALATMATQIMLVAQIPTEEPARLLGVTLTLNELNRLFMLVFLGVGTAAFVTAWRVPHGENFVPVALLILALVCAILLLQDLFIAALLLIAIGLAAVLAIVDLPAGSVVLVGTRVIGSAIKYLVLMAIAGVLMYFGFVLADIYRPGELPGRITLSRFILALLAAGFALRLALVPFHVWLVDVVEDAAPMVSALIAAVCASVSLLVLMLAFQSFPVLLIENPAGIAVLRAGAIATCLAGGLLALGQSGMRRTLGYLIIYNYGMVFYGLTSVTTTGLTAAIFEAINQTLAITLIFACQGVLERPDGRTPWVARRDLLRRWPVAGVGLLGGCLAILGLPPLSGFASKALIYQVAAQYGWLDLLALLLATVLAALAVLRLARDKLLGPGDELEEVEPLMLGETELDRPAPRRLEPEPPSTVAVTLLLLVICLAIGLFPQPLLELVAQATSGLSFIRTLEF